MKQIIIILLVVIVGIMGYNLYKKYHRFNPPNFEHPISEAVDANHPNKELLLNYYQAVEAVNGFVITQWSANEIDVRNPEDDNAQTVAAVLEYSKKLGYVKYYESQLLKPREEKTVVKKNAPKVENRKKLVQKLFYANAQANGLQIGDRGALVYEIQRLLVQKGDSIEDDGIFSTETFNALRAFEEQNGLFADGKLDAITLNYLLN